LFCEGCGNKVNPDDAFCGSCGAKINPIENPVQVESSATSPSITEKAPRKPMDPKTKKGLIIGGVVIGILLAVYIIARSLHGPATPIALQQKFETALEAHDTTTLASLLDSTSNELKNSNSLSAFKESLSNEVIGTYIQQLESQVSLAQTNNGAYLDNHSWLTIKHTSSWLGSSWSVHVVPVEIKATAMANDTVKNFTIDDLKNSQEPLALWPSSYKFKANVANNFANENVSGDINFLDQLNYIQDFGKYTYNLNLADFIKSSLQLDSSPDISNPQILLNGKPIILTGNSTVISPAPTNPSLEIKGTVLGVAIDEKGTINPNDPNPIETLVKQGVAKHALNILYDAALTWTKAYNDSTPSEMGDCDHNGSYYQSAAHDITSPHNDKEFLQKVSVDPTSVEIYHGSIAISDTEYYHLSDRPPIADWRYLLQQQPGKSEWWIESSIQIYWPVKDPTGKFTKVAPQQ
jgi:hypothetical protein